MQLIIKKENLEENKSQPPVFIFGNFEAHGEHEGWIFRTYKYERFYDYLD